MSVLVLENLIYVLCSQSIHLKLNVCFFFFFFFKQSLALSRKYTQWLSPVATISLVFKSHCLGTVTHPASGKKEKEKKDRKKETATKQQSLQTLFGPIFLMFQQGLICWRKCLVPLTAKVTESTAHCADSKQGI